MRILFDDLIYGSTVTADTEDANYPAINLQNDRMKKIYKATSTSSVITVVFDSVTSVNCCYLAFTNATSAILRLYNTSSVLLSTITVSLSRGGQTFTSVSGVASATLTISGSDTIYLGVFGIGESYKMPDPTDGFLLRPIDSSDIDYSTGGQKYFNPVPIRHYIEPQYSFQSVDMFNEILLKWETLHDTGRNAWVDPFEDNTGKMNPMWCHVDMSSDPKTSWGYYNWTHTYTEVF